MKSALLLLLVMVLVASPAASQAPQPMADEARIHNQFLEAINRGDVTAVMTQFTDDAVCGFPLMCIGPEEIRPRIEAIIANRVRFSEISVRRFTTTWTSWSVARFEMRSDAVRVAGVERILQATTVTVRGEKIVSATWRSHRGDAQTQRFLEAQPRPTPPQRRAPEPMAGGKMIDIGGRKLYIECFGTGSPTVVFEAGLDPVGGASGRTWVGREPRPRPGRNVHAAIANVTRACTYDRPGIGLSEPGLMPRDGLRAVADLQALLRNAGERPPYVVVGWSLGASLAYLFASQYRHQVGGLVLLDPTLFPFGYHERLWAALPIELAERDRRATEGFFAASNSPRFLEGGWDLGALADHLRATPALADIPLVVMTAGIPFVNPYEAAPLSFLGGHPGWPDEVIARQEQVRLETYAALARRVPRGSHVILDNSHHMVFRFAPERITAAIIQVVRLVRSK